MLGGKDQDELAEARIIKYETKKSSAFATIDLASAYKDFAKKATRGVAMIRDRRAVLVQDEFEIHTPCEVLWAMTTDAEIYQDKPTIAELRLNGKRLIASVIFPAGAGFVIESAEQKPPEKTNAGVSRLVVRLPDVKGNIRIAVLFSPVWKDGAVMTADLKPLAEW